MHSAVSQHGNIILQSLYQKILYLLGGTKRLIVKDYVVFAGLLKESSEFRWGEGGAATSPPPPPPPHTPPPLPPPQYLLTYSS